MLAQPATLTVLGRYGAYPAPGGAGRGFLVDAGPVHGAVLVGCGSGVAGRLGFAAAAPTMPVAVVLPDLRPDHCSDLWTVGSMAAAAAAAGVRRGLLLVYAYPDPPDQWRRLQRPGVLDVRRFSCADTVRAGGWRFTFCPAAHPWPGASLRAEGPEGQTFGLATPGAETPDLVGLLVGVSLLVVDVGGPSGGLDEGMEGGMPAAAAGRLAAACGARRLLLSHLDPADDPSTLVAEARAAYPGCGIALEGRTYDLA